MLNKFGVKAIHLIIDHPAFYIGVITAGMLATRCHAVATKAYNSGYNDGYDHGYKNGRNVGKYEGYIDGLKANKDTVDSHNRWYATHIAEQFNKQKDGTIKFVEKGTNRELDVFEALEMIFELKVH